MSARKVSPVVWRAFLLASAVLAVSSRADAQDLQTPPAVVAGLEAFTAAGPDSAIAVWFRGAPFDSPDSRETMRRAFDTMHRQAGRMSGYDVVRTFPVGARIRRVFAVLHYERHPGYLLVDAYESPSGWSLLNISFNDDAEKVFPPALLLP
ncbi:MAG TPA: hypothetical protein VK922_13040 [Gemmatimonadaceae bacterium]|nr:hypothetical protein [Gemmatimonadaceae bacterium]